MKQYARINTQGTLEHLTGVPHISNPTEESLALYAAQHDYKPLVTSPAPQGAARCEWIEDGANIVQHWIFPDLDTLKAKAMQRIQEKRDAAMQARAVLPCPTGWNIEYTPNAVTLAQGILTMMLAGALTECTWTDADDLRHEGVSLDGMKLIAATLATHIRSIQDEADARRTRVRTSTTEDELLTILASL